MNLLENALACAADNWPIFPCNKEKRPLTKRGFHSATTDPEEIKKLWQEWPDAGIGVVTGEKSGLLVLDVDLPKPGRAGDGRKSLAELERQYGSLPSTLTARTGSGGRHIYFRYPVGQVIRNKTSFRPGLDIRAQGGYVIAPPSPHKSGSQYLWEQLVDIADPPDWLVQLICDKPEPAPPPASHKASLDDLSSYAKAVLDGEYNRVANATEGARNATLNAAAFSLGQLVAGGVVDYGTVEDVLFHAARACGLKDQEIKKTMRSGLDAGKQHPRAPEANAAVRPRAQEAKSENATTGPVVTEDSLALLFADRYRDDFLYCHESGSWYQWTGTHWEKEKAKYSLHLMRELCREENRDGRPAIGKLVTARGALHFAACDPVFNAAKGGPWDQCHMVIGTPGGAVDLRTGEISPALRTQRITKLAGVAPAVVADCPLWLKFLADCTRGDKGLQRFMRQLAGYALTGDTSEHALFFIYGPGGNGKSVFLNILTSILGNYATTAAMSTFTASNSDSHPTDLAMLRGARLVSVSETEDGRAWAESRIKQMTGGDTITARFMRQDFFQYTPQFKLLIVGNHQPTLRNVDEAARRRFNIIPFIHMPEAPDLDLEEKLKEELPAIFRWAIDGCLDWQVNGLVRPECVIAATAEYFSQQDVFGQWLDECCERGPKLWTETKVLYKSWADFARRNGEEPGDVRKFGPLLSKAGFLPERTRIARGFKGLQLLRKEEWQDNYDR